jgi:hypothetical protein
MTDAAKIARGLTKAQRRTMLRPHQVEALGIQVWGYETTMRVLDRLGLLSNWRRGYSGWSHLTPLGLAVRAELERIADE